KPEPPMAGVHWAKGQAPKTNGASKTSPLLTPHGGDIMPSVQVQPIFWGTNWSSNSFVDKIAGIDTFYEGIGFNTVTNTPSPYADTCSEYGGPSGFVGHSISYMGRFIDYTAAASGSRTGPILDEVCKQIKIPPLDGSGY